MKKCTGCNFILPSQEFHKDKNTKDGLVYNCKKCIKKRSKKYLESNKEVIKKRKQKYYAENKEVIAAKAIEYYKNNKEKIQKYKRDYHIINKEKVAFKDKKYYENNKSRINNRNKKYYKEHKEVITLKNKEYTIKNHTKLLLKKIIYGSSPCKYVNNVAKINEKDRGYNAQVKVDKVLIKCYYCNEYFNPTNREVQHFLETASGYNNMYCSDKCKELCSSFNQRSDVIHPESIQYASKTEQQQARNCQTTHLKQLQIDEFGYNYCEVCGVEELFTVDLHHTLEIAKFGLEAINSAGHLLVCEKCHKEFNKQCK